MFECKCQACNGVFQAEEEWNGMEVTCPYCQQNMIINVPGFPANAQPVPPMQNSSATFYQAAPQQQGFQQQGFPQSQQQGFPQSQQQGFPPQQQGFPPQQQGFPPPQQQRFPQQQGFPPPQYAPQPGPSAGEVFGIIFIIIGYGFFLLAIIDFCGMFFDYDITGFRFSPVIFSLIGSVFQWIGNAMSK